MRDGRFLRLLRAGLLTGVIDGVFSSILAVFFYRSTVARLFQGVASTLLGSKAFEGGNATALVGLAMQFGVAFGWSAVFLALATASPGIRRTLDSRFGIVKVASAYGPFVWLVMSCAVIPFLVHRPPKIGVRWWIQLAGHIPFVGIPIVASIRGDPDPERAR